MMYIVSVMEKLTKDDLAQMSRVYFEKLDQKTLIEAACRLLDFCVHLVERLEQDSQNSSKPPSSDNPYDKKKNKDSKSSDNDNEDAPDEGEKDPEESSSDQDENSKSDAPKRSPGKQPGAKGFWRSEPPVPESILPHRPEFCVICGGTDLHGSDRPYMGFYVYELEKIYEGIRIHCVLHHYYSAVCECGHETKAQPGEGFVSHIEGRRKDLKLTERIMVGPMLATFIAALSVRYRMSRLKIKEFLSCWLSMELSIGSIDRCVREAGVACFPVVEKLLEELQQEDIVKIDETPWYESGTLKWLWVALSTRIAIFHIGSRKKEELLKLITAAFIGWLVSDGYMAYRSYKKRQRCLAHLIRKAIALTGTVDEKAQKMGDWFLREFRGLIKAMAEDGGGGSRCNLILARLKKACNLGSKEDHEKLRALAREILNDWDAVVAFVKNPELPPTNNDAERALRHAVISRRISFGTRTTEGSQAYACLLSVIETCRLRNQDPWPYIAETIALGRKGRAPMPIKA